MNWVIESWIMVMIIEINKDRTRNHGRKTSKTWQMFNMKVTKCIEGSLCF